MSNPTPAMHDFIANSEELRKRCRLTSKIHYNQAEGCRWINTFLGTSAAVLGALTAASFATQFPPRTKSILALGAGTASAMLSTLEPARLCAMHHTAGVEYAQLERHARTWEIRAHTASTSSNDGLRTAQAELDALWSRKAELDERSPIASEMLKSYTKNQVKGKALDK